MMDGAVAVMKVVYEAPVFLKNFRLMVDEVPKVLNSLDALSRSICSIVDGILTEFNVMKKTGIKLESKSRSVYHDLMSLVENALLYIELVNNLCWYGQDEDIRREVEQGIDANDFNPLGVFISQLQQCLVQIGESHLIFTASCHEASKSSVDAAETCKSMAEQQKKRKKATEVIGGVTAGAIGTGGGIAAAGVAVSAAIGPFTAGIGTAIGLGITAVAVGVTTVGATATTAVVTHLIAADFKKLEREFRNLGLVFDRMANEADSMNDIVEGLNLKVTLVSSCLNNVEHSWKNHETVVCLKSSLKLLHKRFSDLHDQSCLCRETVYVKQQQLESCFQTLCSK